VKGIWRGAPLLVSQKDMLIKALELDSVSIGAPLLGNMEGRCFPRAFERRDKFLHLGEIFKLVYRMGKKKKGGGGPCKRAALSIVPCWGTLRGSFTGTFERKRECISEFLFRGTRWD